MDKLPEIKEKIRRYMISNFLFGDEAKMIANNISFLESGIIDSTGILEVIQFIEEHYNIEIGQDDLVPENLDSIDNIVVFIQRKLSGNAPV
jgi:acyl carrier protein